MKKMLMIGAGLALAPMSVAAEPYTCEDLGYVFDKGGCLDETTMVRCPMNLERVWCVGGEMCGKYPVKGAACNDGAKIEWCDLTENMDQSSKRCKYESEDCNSGWEKGILNNVTGNTANCCKEGWDLNPTTGVCEEHVCNKIRYPYTTDDYTYADYAGEIETCRSGNVINFGYVSCNNMWQRGSSNAGDAGYYKCLCKRTDYDNGYVFPFDKSTFYTTFGSGRYGDYHMCADAENSYYGYEHCFRGFEMVKSGGKSTGKCNSQTSYCQLWSAAFAGDLYWIDDDAEIRKVPNSNYKCVYDEKCTAELQNYEECSACIAEASVVDGVHNVAACNVGGYTYLSYMNKCPFAHEQFIGDSLSTGKRPSNTNLSMAGSNYYGLCYGECTWGSNACRRGEMVMKNGKAVGVVVSGSSTYAVVLAYKKAEVFNRDNRTVNGVEYPTGWDAAVASAKVFTPESGVCEAGSGCEAGKWRMPEALLSDSIAYAPSVVPYAAYIRYYDMFYGHIGATLNNPQWFNAESGDTAFQKSSWDKGYISKNTTLDVYSYPVVNMEYK